MHSLENRTKHETQKHRRFLSLKWKALLLFSSLLLLINTSFPVFSYLNLLNQFDSRRASIHEQHVQEFSGLLHQTFQRLQQLGTLIPALAGMNEALTSSEGHKIKSAFERHWLKLEQNMDITTVRFYGPSGQKLESWGGRELQDTERVLFNKWVGAVLSNEQPLTNLSCRQECIQYLVLPIFVEGENIGTLLLGTSMTVVLETFSRIFGVDVGMIVDLAEGKVSPDQSSNVIPFWDSKVIELTHVDRSLNLLKAIARENNSINMLEKGGKIRFDGKYYGFQFIPIKSFLNGDNGTLVILDDTTKTLREIRKATTLSILIGILGLILSEGLLLLIFSIPMIRLRRIAKTLPLLAQDAFQSVRVALGQRSRGWFDDEIDVLDDTAISLSYQLEALDEEVRKRTKILARRMEELSFEKGFIANLLDTARVIILTQNKEGEIMMLNQFGRDLLGHTREELSNKGFTGLLLSDALRKDLKQSLGELFSKEQDHLSHESVISCQNRSSRHIAWVHSRLVRKEGDEPLILSVGLDVTDRKEAESRLTWLADHDPLTGLLNRRRFQKELARILAETERYERSGALLFFDLDQFKYVNDTKGHQAGDALLKVVADQLSRLVRSTDMIARLGGDEFSMVISETSPEGAIQVAEKITEDLAAIKNPIEGLSYKVSASIGIATFPEHGITVEELLGNADLAMYQAKEKGRKGWHLFSSKELIREEMERRAYWKDKIEQALEKDAFILYYQPAKEIESGSLCFYEALIRLREEDGKIILPGAFIPIAEQSGLISEIDYMVLGKVVSRQAELAKTGIQISFSINLSGYTLSDPKLLPFLKDLLIRTGASPNHLILEITETVAVSDLVSACDIMREIIALGFRFSLDDFGMGFSSFEYLKQLPVDYVKIGDPFIRELISHPDDQIFVKSLNEVTQGIGKKTVAEGVEDAETLALLREYGIDYVQGYHLGRPSSTLLE
ncbi:MAG: EAL domain-containing protein [Nitrospiria bacterium]